MLAQGRRYRFGWHGLSFVSLAQDASGMVHLHPLTPAEPAAPDSNPDDAAVDAQHIVDTLPQQTFDDMARIACSICNASMAVVMQLEQARP